MYKKLLIAGASSALLLATIVPAFADDGSRVKVENENTRVRNVTVSISNTGLNRISGHEVEGGRIRTGRAEAFSETQNNVNSTTVDICGCDEESSVKVENENTRVRNTTVSVANTGLNRISGHEVEGGRIRTGRAFSDAYVANVVNTTVVGGE